jgi:DNA-binding LacI/PurR family transcriptional regulator
MVKDGLVERRNGVGTFIKNPKFAKCDRIAIPIRIEGNPFIVACYEEISKIANTLGIQTVLGSGADELGFIERLEQDGVKSMLRFPGDPFHEKPIHDALKKSGIKAVVLNDWWLEGGDFACVRNDEAAAANALLEHLYQNGHRKVILLQDAIFESRTNVVNAFQRWHFRHNIQFDTNNFLYNGYNYKEVSELIQKEGFTAILSTYDINALNIIKRLSSRGISFFDDMSIVSMEGTEEAISRKITVTCQNVTELISTAFRVLLRTSYSNSKVIKMNFEFINGKSVKNII